MHSSDCLARLPRSALGSIVFEHLESVQEECVLSDARRDLPWAVQRAGITEWKGMFGQAVLSLGWDWVQLCNGQIHYLPTVSPRANFLLLDAKGYDQSDDSRELAALVARLPWQSQVLEAIVDSPHQTGLFAH